MSISERDETAILVRDGLHIAGRHVLRMRLPWRGPKAGLMHDPREYKWVGITKAGVRWKILITHLPFGKRQQAESLRRIKRWFGNHRGPTIAGGDWNTPAAKARTGTGERVAGYGIDLTAYKGCRIVHKVRLGKHGSDHHAVLVTYEHTDKQGKDQRLTVIWWNIKVGHKPADVRKAIDGWRTKYQPDAIGLTETYGMGGHLGDLGYQVTLIVGKAKGKKKAKPKVKKPAKPKKAKPSPTATADHVIAVAKTQVGYHEGRDKNGNWNNQQKYSPAVPTLEWSQGQAWCATFVSWVAMTAGVASLFPRTASTDTAASWYQQRGRWSEYPAIGAQGFLAHNGDEFHTFIVASYDDTYIYTVEGNTNDNGSSQGDGVYALKRRRRDTVVEGYGYPAYPEGIVSADPAWKSRK